MTTATLSTRQHGGHVVVALRGELDVVDAPGVMARLAVVVASNPRVILDLTALEYIDCYALNALGQVRAQARQAGGDLRLAAPRRPVLRLLNLTGLIGAYPLYASVEEAVRAAAGSRRWRVRGRQLRPGGRRRSSDGSRRPRIVPVPQDEARRTAS